MIDLQRILVPTDLSIASIPAAEHAKQLADTFGAKVHVLHVLEDPVTIVGEPMATAGLPDIISLRESMREALRNWSKHHIGDDSNVISVMRRGKHFAQILRHADDEKIDLIVMGTHGTSGIEHLLLGSVAENVVRTADCPVLTVRPSQAASA